MLMYDIKEIFIELSNYCLLDCRHCSSSGLSNGNNELNINELKQILKEGKSMGASCVTVSGGEPLLHPDFFSFLEMCKIYSFKVRIYSCGVYLDGNKLAPIGRNVLKTISTFDNIDGMIFSLYGSNDKSHDYITNTIGSFELTLKSIKRAKTEGIKTEIHTVPMSVNYKEIPRIINLAKRLDVKQVALLRLVPQGRCRQNEHLLMDAEQTREFVSIVNSFSWRNVRKGAPFNCLFFGDGVRCSAGLDKVLIGPDGRVFPCEAFKSEKVSSNIKRESLQQIWRNDPRINQVRNLRTEEISFCNSCPEMYTCNGGCPGQRLLHYNNMLVGPDPICINN